MSRVVAPSLADVTNDATRPLTKGPALALLRRLARDGLDALAAPESAWVGGISADDVHLAGDARWSPTDELPTDLPELAWGTPQRETTFVYAFGKLALGLLRHDDQGPPEPRVRAALAAFAGATLSPVPEARALPASLLSLLDALAEGLGVAPDPDGLSLWIARSGAVPGQTGWGNLAHDVVAGLLRPQIARDTVPPAAASTHTLVVASDGGWFRTSAGEEVRLERRRSLRLLAAALAGRPTNEPLAVPRLFALGWPGERISASSAATRVYVAISTLRSLGFPVVKEHDGYTLADGVTVVSEAGAAPADAHEEIPRVHRNRMLLLWATLSETWPEHVEAVRASLDPALLALLEDTTCEWWPVEATLDLREAVHDALGDAATEELHRGRFASELGGLRPLVSAVFRAVGRGPSAILGALPMAHRTLTRHCGEVDVRITGQRAVVVYAGLPACLVARPVLRAEIFGVLRGVLDVVGTTGEVEQLGVDPIARTSTFALAWR